MKMTISKSNGFSLIEVLIAVFIFAVGLLGIAGLQLFAKQNNFDAIQRTTAALLANEIAEKIRANPTSAHLYVSEETDLVNATLPAADCNNTAPCSSDNMASYDLKNWYEAILGTSKQNVAGESIGGLVTPSACINSVLDAAGAVVGYDIAIAWRGKVAMTNPTVNACGSGAGIYGTDDAYRRVLVFTIAV